MDVKAPWISKHWTGTRAYYTETNGKRIDAMREYIQTIPEDFPLTPLLPFTLSFIALLPNSSSSLTSTTASFLFTLLYPSSLIFIFIFTLSIIPPTIASPDYLIPLSIPTNSFFVLQGNPPFFLFIGNIVDVNGLCYCVVIVYTLYEREREIVHHAVKPPEFKCPYIW